MRILLVILLLSMGAQARAEAVGSETGLPLPRFVSIKPAEANLRTGPGTTYPIEWVYRRRGLPVIVQGEHGHWRRVLDSWGVEGWLHKSLLSGRRTALVTHDLAPLKDAPVDEATVLLYAERRVRATLEQCQPDGWCRLSIDGRAGWMHGSDIFGDDADLIGKAGGSGS